MFLGAVFFIPVDGEPLLNIRKVLPNVPWDAWFLILALMPLATCLTADITGVKTFLISTVEPLLSNMTPYFAAVLVIIAATVITQVANNMVVATSFMTLAFSALAIYSNLNMVVVFLLIAIASHIAMVLPSANPIAAMVYAEKDLVDFKSLFKVTLSGNIFLIILVVTVLYAYGNMIF